MSKGKTGISVIADRYAIALIEIAEQNNALDSFIADLGSINNAFNEHSDIVRFLEHPTMPIEEKKDLIKQLFEAHVSHYIMNFLYLLIDRNRITLLANILEHYNTILNKKRNITIAHVTTAIEINDEIINNLRSKLEQKLNGFQIQIQQETDPGIIAGMIVKIGDKVIDGSIKTKLENMKKQLYST